MEEELFTFEQKILFNVKELLQRFEGSPDTVIVFISLVAQCQSIEGTEELEDEKGFYLPNSLLEKYIGMNAYRQNKALKALEGKNILSISRRGAGYKVSDAIAPSQILAQFG